MARRTMSAAQRLQVRRAIRDGHLAFLAEVFGPSAIDRDDYDRLRAGGKIRDEHLLPQDAASAAHSAGAIGGHVGGDLELLAEAERDAVAVARDRVAEHVRALGARLEEAAGRAMTDADDDARRSRLTRSPAVGPPGDEVVARVRKAAADLRRDWFRIAHTEIHNASEEAKAVALAHGAQGSDPRVFKRPHPDACAFCRLLFLKPDGVTPRVFRLSALLANGSNVGRRAGRPARSGKGRTEWKAVVGAVHPFCGCELRALADDAGFDASGRVVYVGIRKSALIEVERPDETLTNHTCEE